MVETFLAVFFIKMDDDLGIRGGRKLVAASRQPGAYFIKIIDFSIEYDPDGCILVRDRLTAPLTINDGKTPHTEGDPFF